MGNSYVRLCGGASIAQTQVPQSTCAQTQHEVTTWGKDPWDRVLRDDIVAIPADKGCMRESLFPLTMPSASSSLKEPTGDPDLWDHLVCLLTMTSALCACSKIPRDPFAYNDSPQNNIPGSSWLQCPAVCTSARPSPAEHFRCVVVKQCHAWSGVRVIRITMLSTAGQAKHSCMPSV